jgi:hypothetical protein
MIYDKIFDAKKENAKIQIFFNYHLIPTNTFLPKEISAECLK